jgi:hypothetical protein
MFPEIKFSTASSGWWITAWIVWLLVYGATLTYLLNRRRFASPERILWFLVITFVPVFGVLLFFLIGEDDQIPGSGTSRKKTPLADTAGTPWQDDPGHTKDSAP